MFWWLSTAGALAGTCDPNEAIARALQGWLAGDAQQTRAALDEATAAFGCSPLAEPQALARYWIVDGAVRWSTGQRDDAIGSFAAARRVAPDVWLVDLGAELRQAWSTAADPQGTGTLVIRPEPGAGLVWIDGAPADAREIPCGLHLVQVGRAGAPTAVFARSVWLDPGVSVEVDVTPREEPAPVPVPGTPHSEPVSIRPVFQAFTGASASYGGAAHARGASEPNGKIAVPVELGAGVAGPFGYALIQLGGAWLADGDYLARAGDGSVVSRSTRLDLGAAAGIGQDVRFGLSGGVRWPSRLDGRAVVGWSPVHPLAGELRLGVDYATDRRVEPAGELLIGVRF